MPDPLPEPPKSTLKTSEVIFTIVCSILTALPSMPVVWRVVSGFLAWIGFLHLISEIGYFRRVPRDVFWLRSSLITICFFIVSWNLITRAWRAERAADLEGELMGAEEGLVKNATIPWVQIGESKTRMMMRYDSPGIPYFKLFQDAEFLVEGGKAPLVSTQVRDRFGNLVVDIKRNHWTCHPPYCSDKNSTKVAFEVKDSSDHVLLQIKLISYPPTVQVQGEWWNNEGRGIRIIGVKDDGVLSIPLVTGNQDNDRLIQNIFEYPSKDHWGEFAKQH